jgi:hypothetical protein
VIAAESGAHALSVREFRAIIRRWTPAAVTRFALFLVSTFWLAALERGMRSHTLDGVHYQKWSSDVMLQTLPIEVLRAAPLQALYYLHIQPPVLDIVRATFAQFFPRAAPAELVLEVDTCLSRLYIVLFGLLSVCIYEWTRRLTQRSVALVTWLVWIVYPGAIFYTTIMEGTFLSAFLVFLFFYELWRFGQRGRPVYRITTLTLCLFFTRTIFQWYFFPLVFFLLLFQRARPKQLAIFVGISLLFVGPYLAKQKILFDTLSTTTYAGYFQAGIFWYQPTPAELEAEKRALSYRYPQRALLHQGDKPYNGEDTALDNIVYPKLTYRHCKEHFDGCTKALMISLSQNVRNYWKPSATFSRNGLTDNLFWSKAFNWVFSGSSYQAILAFGAVAWALWSVNRWPARRGGKPPIVREVGQSLSLLIPAAFIFSATMLANRGPWIEADRLKFMLEPVFFVFCAGSFYRLSRLMTGRG